MAGPRPFTVSGVSPLLVVLCAAEMLLGGAAANAQRRVVMMPVPAPARTVVRTAPVQSAHIIGTPISHSGIHQNNQRAFIRPAARPVGDRRENRNFRCANGANISVQQLLNPVPPYGFNYQYLNSIGSDAGIEAAIDPATEVELNQARRIGCNAAGAGGYVLWGGGGYAAPEEVEQEEPESAPAAQPQVIVVQVPATSQTAAAKPAVAEEEEPALPDEGQFVLVMRDGTEIQAAAFTRSANSIVYITPDGFRRTALLSDLDTDATIRLNGERGMQIQLSL
jgi:hypothetical protein